MTMETEIVEVRREPMKKRKKAAAHDVARQAGLTMLEFIPRGDRQEDARHAWHDGSDLLLTGCAGTGKTFLAINLAFSSLSNYPRGIVVVRSAVPVRDMGFMPGDAVEKGALFEDPYEGIFQETFGRDDAYSMAKSHGLVRFATTSYLRGVTWKDCIVVLEEYQNMTFQELDTVVTRIGENARVIVTGDCEQSDSLDARDRKGAEDFVYVLRGMGRFEEVEFGIEDVQRSGFVRDYLETKRKLHR